MSGKILGIKKLGTQWEGLDPFLVIMHHRDRYPAGNESLGPAASLEGRDLGMDFSNKDGWSMYHGHVVPGFPEHPHRGFETVTSVLEGYVDHSDSAGSTGRYGGGDVQWMTAGKGGNHTEMFPLLNQDGDNPLNLFQIWMNLPAKSKFADFHYKMLWDEEIPVVSKVDGNGRSARARLVAGTFDGVESPAPAPSSWAADKGNHVGIWHIDLEPEATITLPRLSPTLNRAIYFHKGESIQVEGTEVPAYHMVRLTGNDEVRIVAGRSDVGILLLEGEPIGEPVVSYGPFVVNSEQEIADAYNDYNETGFGGWPWDRVDPVHPREKGRFARYADGTVEER